MTDPPDHLESSETKEDFKFPSLEKESVFLLFNLYALLNENIDFVLDIQFLRHRTIMFQYYSTGSLNHFILFTGKSSDFVKHYFIVIRRYFSFERALEFFK